MAFRRKVYQGARPPFPPAMFLCALSAFLYGLSISLSRLTSEGSLKFESRIRSLHCRRRCSCSHRQQRVAVAYYPGVSTRGHATPIDLGKGERRTDSTCASLLKQNSRTAFAVPRLSAATLTGHLTAHTRKISVGREMCASACGRSAQLTVSVSVAVLAVNAVLPL